MDFNDIVFYDGPEKILSFRSGLTVYEESFQDGKLYARGWNGAGYMQNVLEYFPTRLDMRRFTQNGAFYLEADGCTPDGTWEWIDWHKEEQINENGVSVLHCALMLRTALRPLQVTVHTRLDGTGVLERYLSLQSLSDAPIALTRLTVMGGALECIGDWRDAAHGDNSDALYRLGYMDDHRWAHEGLFRWHDLPSAQYSVAGRYMRDRFRHPMFLLQNKVNGTIFSAQFGWSGGYAFDFDLDAAGKDSALSFAVRIDSPAPFLILQPDEEYETPHVHMGMCCGDPEDAVHQMHTHIRRSVYTIPEARGTYGWVEAGMGPERRMDFDAVRHFADTAAQVGAETLILDAGWFCKAGREADDWGAHTGDWHHDPDKYPDAMAAVRDYIHSKGLLFGLWADIEGIGHASQLYQAHPDWTLGDSNILDMTRPEVAAHVEHELTRMITDYKLDLFRLDNNTNYRDFAQYSTAGGRQAAISRYYKAVYAMYARLRHKFSDVVFENCAGGGGRTDLGLAALFSHTWVSDWQKAPRSAAITNGMTMALPPERVDRLISGMECHTMGSLGFQVRHALFGRPTVNDFHAVGSRMNPNQIEFVRRELEIYKTYIRPYIPHSRIFHHTPEIYGEQPCGDCILERCSESGDAGVVGVFRLAGLPLTETITVFPRGILPSIQYRVTLDNSGQTFLLDGYTLQNAGIQIHLPAALQSELILYKAEDTN